MAHEISEEAWLLVNDEDMLKENTNPKPASLSSYADIVNKTFKFGETINLRINESVIKKTFNVNNFDTNWIINLTDNRKGNEIDLLPDKEGVYNIIISINASNEEIVKEVFELFVGTKPEITKIRVNSTIIDNEINISRDDFVKFTVDNPNTNYRYVWDLGDGETKEGVDVEKLFENTKLPLYVFLRTIGLNSVYTDNYIKIDSNEPPKFKVNTPFVRVQESDVRDQNLIVIALILGTPILIIIILYSTFYILHSRKRKSGKI